MDGLLRPSNALRALVGRQYSKQRDEVSLLNDSFDVRGLHENDPPRAAEVSRGKEKGRPGASGAAPATALPRPAARLSEPSGPRAEASPPLSGIQGLEARPPPSGTLGVEARPPLARALGPENALAPPRQSRAGAGGRAWVTSAPGPPPDEADVEPELLSVGEFAVFARESEHDVRVWSALGKATRDTEDGPKDEAPSRARYLEAAATFWRTVLTPEERSVFRERALNQAARARRAGGEGARAAGKTEKRGGGGGRGESAEREAAEIGTTSGERAPAASPVLRKHEGWTAEPLAVVVPPPVTSGPPPGGAPIAGGGGAAVAANSPPRMVRSGNPFRESRDEDGSPGEVGVATATGTNRASADPAAGAPPSLLGSPGASSAAGDLSATKERLNTAWRAGIARARRHATSAATAAEQGFRGAEARLREAEARLRARGAAGGGERRPPPTRPDAPLWGAEAAASTRPSPPFPLFPSAPRDAFEDMSPLAAGMSSHAIRAGPIRRQEPAGPRRHHAPVATPARLPQAEGPLSPEAAAGRRRVEEGPAPSRRDFVGALERNASRASEERSEATSPPRPSPARPRPAASPARPRPAVSPARAPRSAAAPIAQLSPGAGSASPACSRNPFASPPPPR